MSCDIHIEKQPSVLIGVNMNGEKVLFIFDIIMCIRIRVKGHAIQSKKDVIGVNHFVYIYFFIVSISMITNLWSNHMQ